MTEVDGRLNFLQEAMKDKEKRIKDTTNQIIEAKGKLKRIDEECRYALSKIPTN